MNCWLNNFHQRCSPILKLRQCPYLHAHASARPCMCKAWSPSIAPCLYILHRLSQQWPTSAQVSSLATSELDISRIKSRFQHNSRFNNICKLAWNHQIYLRQTKLQLLWYNEKQICIQLTSILTSGNVLNENKNRIPCFYTFAINHSGLYKTNIQNSTSYVYVPINTSIHTDSRFENY